jgi:DNA-binding transcriptional MerR regulator
MTKQFRLENGLLKIGEIAKELSINQSTIRYYTEIGLLPVVETTESGYRLYDREETGRRISIIREINAVRMNLNQIKMKLA